ncbi:IS66 family insertion sequence element accessory protein TnpB [Legionella sainthelensi]|uniref:IS66 family insertion sequence element accessory protein TnpB n=1 Tax=Legionella sainthelensi TaxID=28087 RepID=UPI00135BA8C8|nr:IS66 family insertion sequence element accessory protein TnpB [Legionella sainthelensi]
MKALCRKKLLDDPFSGTVFVFINRMRTPVKIFVYDASGFWLCQKRFSRGQLAWWPSGLRASVELRSNELLKIT